MKALQRPRSFDRFLLGICASVSALLSFNIAPSAEDNKVEISTVSTRADYVTGGDVLVRVRVPASTDSTDVTIWLNGTDVTSQFWTGDGLTALLTDLPLGESRLEAKAKHGGADMLEIQNHLITGPVFSGPQEEPFFCQTHLFMGLGGPLTSAPIANPCFVSTRVNYWYRPVGPAFTLRAFNPSGPRPTDIATTISGVPYILRLETGTINRAIYQIAILDDPAVSGPDPRGGTDPGWNGRLVYTFGGGCNAGWYIQGASTGGVTNDAMLTRGFAVASSSLNVLGNNCNDVVSAETLMMVKERFIEANGAPRYTIGWGCSGGAIQQYMIGDNYPGLLDGLVPQCSFPEQFGAASPDARLLRHYVMRTAAVPWSQEALRAASGFGTYGHIEDQGTVWAARIDPVPNRGDGFASALFNTIVPPEVRYHPTSNPTGARATVFDHNINTFGPDERGFARWPLDNVGIQYGLAALNAGQITTAQFLDLNEKIGGFDRDANFISSRTVADHHATQAAYATGKIVAGGAGLSSVPILDVDVIYTDLDPTGDIHLKYNHFSVRERLIKANGHADNMVIWSGAFGPRGATAATQALVMMDGWLANIAADASSDPLATKVVRNKPPTLMDGCWTGTTPATTTFVAELQFFGGPGTSSCNTLYPAFGFPRLAAGAPLSNDIIKCRLRDIDLTDYAVTLTPSEDARLRTIFPDGVCDYLLPGHDQRNLLDTWLMYEGGGVFKKSPR